MMGGSMGVFAHEARTRKRDPARLYVLILLETKRKLFFKLL